MEIIIRLELDRDKDDTVATRECVYSYLEALIEDDSLDYEIRGCKDEQHNFTS